MKTVRNVSRLLRPGPRRENGCDPKWKRPARKFITMPPEIFGRLSPGNRTRRFGKSLFGSSACSGKIDMDEIRGLKDKDGVRLIDAVKKHGIDFEKVKDS